VNYISNPNVLFLCIQELMRQNKASWFVNAIHTKLQFKNGAGGRRSEERALPLA
jgi:hypothetical protein